MANFWGGLDEDLPRRRTRARLEYEFARSRPALFPDSIRNFRIRKNLESLNLVIRCGPFHPVFSIPLNKYSPHLRDGVAWYNPRWRDLKPVKSAFLPFSSLAVIISRPIHSLLRSLNNRCIILSSWKYILLFFTHFYFPEFTEKKLYIPVIRLTRWRTPGRAWYTLEYIRDEAIKSKDDSPSG